MTETAQDLVGIYLNEMYLLVISQIAPSLISLSFQLYFQVDRTTRKQ